MWVRCKAPRLWRGAEIVIADVERAEMRKYSFSFSSRGEQKKV